MYVPEIIEVKDHLDKLKKKGMVKEWELPYENILTRRSAAIFFLTPAEDADMKKIWKELSGYEGFAHGLNEEKKLSELDYQITFDGHQEEGQPS